jgi:hypothetical protein
MNTAETFRSEDSPRITRIPHSRAEFEVIVVFTHARPTLRALKAAARLAKTLGARIRLIVPHTIPPSEHLKGRYLLNISLEFPLRTIVGTSKVETRLDVRFCHDRWEMLQRVLAPGSVVVLDRGNHWWSTAETRLARDLRAAGHHVILSSGKE